MKIPLALAAAAALAAGTLTTPAAALAPAKKKAGGTVVVDVANGCSVRLVGPGKAKQSRKVSGAARGLKPGVYRLKATPKTCKASPKKVRVKKGKKARARVLNDPKFVPTTLIGTFSGKEQGPYMNASWSGQITLKMQFDGIANGPPGPFQQSAQYQVSEASGTWTIGGSVPGGCVYEGAGSFGLSDFRLGDNLWMNPWNNYAYAFEVVSNSASTWPYTATCPDVRSERRPPPFRLLATNEWSGIDPVPPLPTGDYPSGSFTWRQGETSTTWTWDFSDNATLGKEYSKP